MDTTAMETMLAEMRAAQAEGERVRAERTHTEFNTTPAELRRMRREGLDFKPPAVQLPQGQDRLVPGRAGSVPIGVFVPPGAVAGVYFYLHGGGWVFGGARMQDAQLWEIAQAASVAVVSVEYRLAPEFPHPAAAEDCEDAALWLIANAQREFGTNRLVLGGASAGTHLGVLTLLRLRDRHGLRAPFLAANLEYGSFDLSMTPSQRLNRQTTFSRALLAWHYDCLLPDLGPEERRHPDVSPLYASLEGLPPALFTVGAADPLLDDTLFLEARWRTAGNSTQLRVIPEAQHGFTNGSYRLAVIEREFQQAFIRSAVLAPGA